MVDETNETSREDESGEPVVTVEDRTPPETAGDDESTSREPAGEDADADAAPESEEETHGLTLGSGAPAEGGEDETPRPAPMIRGKIDRFGVAMGTGRRKTSVARVRIKDGSGQIVINGRPIEQYVVIERDRLFILAPLRAVEMEGKVDISVSVHGGGPTGQAGAIVLGVARALQAKQPEFHAALADGGYLTRDSRMVERKKYGRKKARRSFQFSKR